jgi:hypothetical protein
METSAKMLAAILLVAPLAKQSSFRLASILSRADAKPSDFSLPHRVWIAKNLRDD